MTLLMLGRHLELGHYRVEFLKSHGFNVIFPESRQAAIEAIRRGGFDAVILSYSLSDETLKELVELVEQVCPKCPLISITEHRWHDSVVRPDATVLASDPPQSLLDAIHRVQPRGNSKSGMRRVK
jgi:DNA-binding NtrC family response regulator